MAGRLVKAWCTVFARKRQVVSIRLPDLPDTTPKPEDIPIEVVYEDEALTVVNKPAAMVTHPAKGKLARDAGECAPVSLRQPVDPGRRKPPGHRPSSRPRGDTTRPTGGGQERAGPSAARRPVRTPRGPQGISGPGVRRPRAPQRLHRAADRLSSDVPRENGHPRSLPTGASEAAVTFFTKSKNGVLALRPRVAVKPQERPDSNQIRVHLTHVGNPIAGRQALPRAASHASCWASSSGPELISKSAGRTNPDVTLDRPPAPRHYAHRLRVSSSHHRT